MSGSLSALERKRKQVFRPVLHLPHTEVAWPFVAPALGNDVAALAAVLLRSHRELFTTGFNLTVEPLEEQAGRRRLPENTPLPVCVLVCKLEISPPLLVQHLPVLCAAAGAKLVQLPPGSFQQLLDAVGRDTYIVGVRPAQATLLLVDMCSKVEDVAVPYLDRYVKTNVGMVPTTKSS